MLKTEKERIAAKKLASARASKKYRNSKKGAKKIKELRKAYMATTAGKICQSKSNLKHWKKVGKRTDLTRMEQSMVKASIKYWTKILTKLGYFK